MNSMILRVALAGMGVVTVSANSIAQQPAKPISAVKPTAQAPVAAAKPPLPPSKVETNTAVDLPAVRRLTLANGVQLILAESSRAPVMSVRILFRGGAAQDSPDRAGLSGMMATLLRSGTENRSARDIAAEVDFLGASLSTDANDDAIEVSLDLLSRNAKQGIDLIADLLRNSNFPSDEVERQRNLASSGLKSLLEEPGAIADRMEVSSTFHGHPYGNQATLASIAALSREDILACARQNLAPERMIIVCVGAMPVQQQTQLFKSAFDSWQRGKDPLAPPPAVKPATRKFVVVDKPDATQAQVRWSIITPPGNRPDRLASRVASAILGGGFTSRLVDEIRVKRSLTYSIGSRFNGMERAGMFEVRSFTKTSTIKELMDATEAILLYTATKGFTQAELTKIKGYLSGQFASQMQTSSTLAARLADMALYGLPADELETYLAKLNALKLAEVNLAARRYIQPQNLNITVVAPAKDMSKAYAGRGKADVIPAEKTVE